MTLREATIAQVACPTCGAVKGEPCRVHSGRNHHQRVVAAIVFELRGLAREKGMPEEEIVRHLGEEP